MADNTAIEWADRTWNPVLGCVKVSPGCDGCYAITQAHIRASNPHPRVASAFNGLTQRTPEGLDWTGRVNLIRERLGEPFTWRKPQTVFVNSLSDLFHPAIPESFIADVFQVMAATPRHTYQVLTKRHGRMRGLLRKWSPITGAPPWVHTGPWPLPNVWLGVSVEDQERAELRIPALLETPAAVRWISAEPLLGPVDLRNLKARNGALIDCLGGDVKTPGGEVYSGAPSVLDWVVTGGESGKGARPPHPDWFRRLRDQCQELGTAFFLKQWGSWRPQPRYATDDRHHVVMVDGHDRGTPWPGWRLDQPDAVVMERVSKKSAGRELDGRTWDELPGAREVVVQHG
ncbi:DUF5131 family protein [Acrocarpospora catenulata]|uniref:DUF5131 family protein n=1 Tax=Acrocarpospora catenulata TaxID=2836182 RepID=UPI001BDADE3A|nr:phage Gp37/Gp68 family protein [Acrocarpospora catenulata]